MRKSLILFLVSFVVAAALTLAIRTARHDPHSSPTPIASPTPSGPSATPDLHTSHTDHPNPGPTASAPVNTVCALCGMDVDPSIPPAAYQGKLVGFGCRACPPRFAADPERWGPSALRNEVLSD